MTNERYDGVYKSLLVALIFAAGSLFLMGSECETSGGSNDWPSCSSLNQTLACDATGFPASYCDSLVGCEVRTCIDSNGEKKTSCFEKD